MELFCADNVQYGHKWRRTARLGRIAAPLRACDWVTRPLAALSTSAGLYGPYLALGPEGEKSATVQIFIKYSL